MSLRTVGVRLIADVTEYVTKMKAAAKATDDVADNLEKTKAGQTRLDEAAKSADNLSNSATRAAASMDKAGKSAGQTATMTKGLADAIAKVQKQAEAAHLKLEALGNAATDARIKQERAQLDLNATLTKYKDISEDAARSDHERADAVNRIAAAQHKLDEATRRVAGIEIQRVKTNDFLKSLPSPAELAKVGGKMGQSLSEGMGNAIKGGAGWALKTPLIAVAAGAALAAAPVVGGTIAAAVIGAGGMAGVVGGVLLAVQDSRVKEAGKTLGAVLLETFGTSAERYMVAPTLEAIKKVQRWATGMLPDMNRLFEASAKNMGPLLDGLLYMLQRIIQGIATAAEKGGPVIDAFAVGFAQLGDALGDMFEDLSDNSVSAAAALKVFFDLVVGLIKGVTLAVEFLTETFGFFARLGAFGREAQTEFIRLEANAKIAGQTNQWVESTFISLRQAGIRLADGIGKTITALGESNGLKGTAIAESIAHADALKGELDAYKALSDAQRAMVDPLFAVIEAQDKVEKAQIAYTKAVKKHGGDSLEASKATRDLAKAAFELQEKVGAAGGSFDGKLTPSMIATFKAAGLTKSEIKLVQQQLAIAKEMADDYDGAYKGEFSAPGAVDSAKKAKDAWDKATGFDGQYRAQFSAPGAVKSKEQAADAWAQAKGFDGKYSAYLSTKGYSVTYGQLKNLLIQQQALSKGISVSSAKSAFNKQELPAYAVGGRVEGPGTETSDSIPALLSQGEFVIKASSAKKIGYNRLKSMNDDPFGEDVPRFAKGGVVNMKFPVTTEKAKILTLAQALAIVQPAIPAGGMTYPWIVKMAQAMVPGIKAISTFRKNARTLSGNVSYHSKGQAVDFPPSEALARGWNARYGKYTNELITPYQKYNLHNGRKHTYTGAVWNQHNFAGGNAHDHIAVSGSLGGNFGSSVAATGSLLGWIMRALSLTKTPSSWIGPLTTLIKRESGGNPRAINNWDSNARKGQASRGLMQTIPSTFAAYRLKSLPNNIFDPVANIVAGIRYIKARYGTIFNVQQANASKPPKGYANGGVITEPITGVGASGRRYTFGEYGPETVIPGNKWMGGGGTSMAVSNTFQINVSVAATANQAEVGRQVVGAIQAYERGSGKTWRS